jgi:membrane complex biogenesis BtpA family protein
MNPDVDMHQPYLLPPATDETTFTVEGKPIIGMIHVGALPGTPGSTSSVAEIVEQARIEARIYAECGVKCVMVENMHDVPYLSGGVGPEITAAMTLVAAAVKLECDLPVGIQILAGADFEALAVAHTAGLDFIRAECFAFAHVADEGLMQSNAAKLLRYRKQIGATDVQVWADIKKKHSAHAITADISIGAMAEALEFMGADAVIVTGPVTGREPKLAEIKEARERSNLPVFVGSGMRIENLGQFLTVADGVIIGSAFKRDGNWREAPDPGRIRSLVQRAADILAFEAQAGPLFRV